MFDLFNYTENLIYQLLEIQNWLFTPIDLGPLGYIAPLGIFSVSSLLLLLGIFVVRLIV